MTRPTATRSAWAVTVSKLGDKLPFELHCGQEMDFDEWAHLGIILKCVQTDLK